MLDYSTSMNGARIAGLRAAFATLTGNGGLIDRGLWWSVWWPWAVTWFVTVLAVVVAAVVFVVAWRARGRFSGTTGVPGLTIYLNKNRVTDIYQVGGYGDAITKQVVETVGVTKDGKLRLGAQEIGVEAGLTSGREVIKTYMEEYGAIQAIGVVLEGLESAHSVVHLDLYEPSVVHNTALKQQLRPVQPVSADRLNRINCYVLVAGEFRVMDGTNDGTTVFLAPIGNPDNPKTGPQVRVECDNDGLRHEETLPHDDNTLHARCLGKVQTWREQKQELVITPVAIFR